MKERENRKRPYTRIERETIEAFCRSCEDPTTRMTWKQRLAVFVALVLAVFISYKIATASPFLITDPQSIGEAGTRYEIQIDGGEWISANRIEADSSVTLREDMAPKNLTDGEHTFLVRACDLWGCGPASDPLIDVKRVPSKPATPRLVAE